MNLSAAILSLNRPLFNLFIKIMDPGRSILG